MSRRNPLAESLAGDPEDRALVLRPRPGDRDALEELVRRHQAWIYNIAVRMLYHPQDAEDATQEILIKALTALSSFQGRRSFRTWRYRIVVNDVLNAKRGRFARFCPESPGQPGKNTERVGSLRGGLPLPERVLACNSPHAPTLPAAPPSP
ncbi:MAG: hypothetical protein DME09_16230 [Candidatus Rokuibacteriota bacterium]|nr:MAG: hypothetical protein DME09_16230 [Candidatus Rokubacteria bacterium]